MKEILTILIAIGSSYLVDGGDKTVNMVTFGGQATGSYFNGRVLPGGVDTQEYFPDGRSSLSARYMLEGVDSVGDTCRVFVSNVVTSATPKGFSEPTVVTDSPYLRALTSGKLTGKLDFSDGQLTIRIYADEK